MRTALTPEEIQSYRDRGFVVIEDFLDSAELEEWRRCVDEAVAGLHRIIALSADYTDDDAGAERDKADHEPLRGGPHGEALRAKRDDGQDQIEGGQMNTGDAHDGEIDR